MGPQGGGRGGPGGAAGPPPTAGREVLRAVLAADGRVKVAFAGGAAVVLEPTGASFTAVGAGRPPCRQLSAFAVREFRARLAVALRFRNAHVDVPYWCPCLEAAARPFRLRAPLAAVAWPALPAAAEGAAAAGGAVQRLPDGSVQLWAEDREARLVLARHGVRFSVTYPLLIEGPRAGEAGGGECTYAWQTQTFSTAEYPERWRDALEGLRAYLGAADLAGAAERRGSPAGAGPSGGRATSALPVALRDYDAPWQEYPDDSWWLQPSDVLYPTDAVVRLEWTREVMYEFLPAAGEMEVLLGHDDSAMRSMQKGEFFLHVWRQSKRRMPEDAQVDQIYSAQDPPPKPVRIGKKTLNIKSVVSHAAALFGVNRRNDLPGRRAEERPGAGAGEGGRPAAEVGSMEVKEEAEVRDVGRFVAYADGRAWAKFVDRTILRMDRWHETCTVTLPYGEVRVVNAQNPVGVEKYVRTAAEFVLWAFRTPEERDAAAALQEEILGNANKAGQMARLLAWELHHRAPAPPPAKEPEGRPKGYTPKEIGALLEKNSSMIAELATVMA